MGISLSWKRVPQFEWKFLNDITHSFRWILSGILNQIEPLDLLLFSTMIQIDVKPITRTTFKSHPSACETISHLQHSFLHSTYYTYWLLGFVYRDDMIEKTVAPGNAVFCKVILWSTDITGCHSDHKQSTLFDWRFADHIQTIILWSHVLYHTCQG